MLSRTNNIFGGKHNNTVVVGRPFDPHSIVPTKHVNQDLGISGDASRSGSIFFRIVPQDIGLAHRFSDFYGEEVISDMTEMSGVVAGPLDINRSLTGDISTLTQKITVAGNLFPCECDGGEGIPELDSVTGENIAVGEIVYLNASLLELAQADSITTSHVVGICTVGALSGFTASYLTEGVLVMTDWTNTVGSVNLVKGSLYFLDESNPGMMTTTAPTSVGEAVVVVGTATSPTTLDLQINEPILL